MLITILLCIPYLFVVGPLLVLHHGAVQVYS